MIIFNYYFPRKIVVFFLVILLAVSLPLILIVVKRQQDIRQRATVGSVTLRLTPDSTTKTIGQTVDVQTSLDASANNITGVDIRLHFDPNILELTSANPSTLFNTELIRSVDNNAGTIRYAAVNTANTTITGTVDLGTLHFRTKNSGSAAITIDANPQIAALNTPALLAVDPPINTSIDVGLPPTITLGPSDSPTPTTPLPTGVPTTTPIPTATPAPPTVTLAPGPTNTPTPLTPTPTQAVTPGVSVTPPPHSSGNANGDGAIDLLDFNIWKDEFTGVSTTTTADFDGVDGVTLLDFNIWKDAFLRTL